MSLRIPCIAGAVASIALGIAAVVSCSDSAATSTGDGGAAIDPTGDGAASGEGGAGSDGASGDTTCTRTIHVDPTFGKNGVVTDLGQVTVDYEDISFERTRAFPYPDGSLGLPGFPPVKLLASGARDTSFDADATIKAFQSQTGAVFAAGPARAMFVSGSRSSGFQVYDAFVARLTSTGALDSTYGSAGFADLAHLGIAGAHVDVIVEYLVPLTSGALLVAGSMKPDGGATDPRGHFLVRLTAAGLIDASFGKTGLTVYRTPYFDRLSGVAVHDDGTLAVALEARNASAGPSTINYGHVLRFTADGAPITTFGDAGAFDSKVLTDLATDILSPQPGGFDVVRQSIGVARRIGPGGVYAFPFGVHGSLDIVPTTISGGDVVGALRVVPGTQTPATGAVYVQRFTPEGQPCSAPVTVVVPGVRQDSMVFSPAGASLFLTAAADSTDGSTFASRFVAKLVIDP